MHDPAPATNTSQFGWVLNRLSYKPRPMGKIYQPEVAARAIVFACTHYRRFMWVGSTTYIAILGNRLLRAYAGWRLAKTGFMVQQTTELVSPNQPDNLWYPILQDRSSHGNFDKQAHVWSLTTWLAIHRTPAWFVLIIIILAVLAIAIWG
jgi:hypothetical protein